MTTVRYALIRTIQVRNTNVPGTLGALATAIGDSGANIGNIQTVHISQNHVLRDIDVQVNDDAHLSRVLVAVAAVPGVEVVESRDEVLGMHLGGKIETISRFPVENLATLRKVYTPGVAEVSRVIAQFPDRVHTYTGISNTVAIITDGTAVLGLGNVGLAAAMPVMEGKSALLHQFAGVSGVPILVNAESVDKFVDTVARIAPTFGGIHLEDIGSPECFEIVRQLRSRLDKPVMQDDQDGTAAVVLGAVMAACKAAGKKLDSLRIGQIGLGAAGLAIGKLLMEATQNPVTGADIDKDSLARMGELGGQVASMEEVIRRSDILIATTGVPSLIPPDLIGDGQIVLALSNPDPEITPEMALEHGASFAADGSSVNNVLGYPGIWKGALRTRANAITGGMLVAAGTALANLTPPGELSPSALDPAVHKAVAYAVGKAAVDAGIGQITGLDSLE